MASQGKRKTRQGAPPTSDRSTPMQVSGLPTETGVQPPWMHWAAGLVIAMLGCIAFSTSFGGQFIFDGIQQIEERAALRGQGDLLRLLRHSYRPFVEATFAMNVELTGAEPNEKLPTAGFHLVNLLIHIAAGLTLFGVVRRTLLLPRFNGRFKHAALWIAFAVAAIWTVHPLQTQSVTYIVQRAESLMGLCYLLTFYGYIRGATAAHKPWRWYALAVVACTLGMMSKAVMVTAPALLVLYELCFFTGSWSQRLRRRGAALGVISATLLTVLFTGVAQGVLDPTPDPGATVGFSYQQRDAGGATWWRYLITQSEVILHYLRLSVWPRPLVLDYNWPLAESFKDVALPFAVLCGLGVATLVLLWKRPPIGFVAAAFFIILAPTSSVIPIKDVAFEHRMYLPLAAVVALIVLAVTALLNRLMAQRVLPKSGQNAVAALLLLMTVAPLTAATITRNLDYHDAQHMWGDVLAKRPDHPRALNNLATALVKQANHAEDEQTKAKLNAQACAYFQQVLELDPDDRNLPMHKVYYNLANCLVRDGRVQDALPLYEQAIARKPDNLRAQIMYGNALSRLGEYEKATARYDAAIMYGQPDRSAMQALLVARAYYNRGNQLDRLDRIDEAIDSYAAAARISTAYAKAYYELGRMYEQKEDFETAAQSYRFLLRLIPDHEQARQRLKNLESRGF